jgi:hypothetical protein
MISRMLGVDRMIDIEIEYGKKSLAVLMPNEVRRLLSMLSFLSPFAIVICSPFEQGHYFLELNS